MTKQKKYPFLLFFCFLLINTQAQLVGNIEVGTGTQGNEWLQYEAGAALGYNILNNALCGFGGIKMQKLPIVAPSDLRGSENNYIEQTTDLWNFSIFVGLRYSLNIFETKKGSEGYIGVFPEFRLFFSPLIPHKIVYIENNYPAPNEEITLKGENMSQWAAGIGGGIYYGNRNKAFIALKFETNTIDLFESMRSLDYKNELFSAQRRQYIISIVLYGLI